MSASPNRPQLVQGAVVVVAVVATVTELLITVGLTPPGLVALDLLVGWLFVGWGIAVWKRRTTLVGPLMIGTGIAWFLGGLLHRGPLVHLLLTYPEGRLTNRPTAVLVAFAYADGVVGSFVALDGVTLALAVAIAGVAIHRLLGVAGPVRRGRLGACSAAIAMAVILALRSVAALAAIEASAMQLVVYELLLAATVTGLAVDLISGGWSRRTVTGLVVELGTRADAGTVRDRLGRALGDPSLIVGYALAGTEEFIDEAGRPVELPAHDPDRAITPIRPAGGPRTVLIHDAAVLSDEALVDAVAAAAGVAVANIQLQSEILERVVEVAASQRRIVEAADRQRHHLERDLNVGVIARISRVSEILARVQTGVDGPAQAEVAAVIGELEGAEEELRRFARGMYPSTLATGGLARAIAELASRSSTPITVVVAPDRLPAGVEATAYFVCSEALANVTKHAHASQANIELKISEGWIDIRVTDDGVGGADISGSGIQGLVRRVEAVGGELTITSPAGNGTVLATRLPLDRPREHADATPHAADAAAGETQSPVR